MRYDLIFITAALICLLSGEALGIWMGVAHDFTFAPVHAHLNLLGWATLALFGLMHRAYPALSASRLAGAQCARAVASSIAMPAGIGFAMMTQNPAIAIVAALGVLAATATFLAMFMRKARA